MPYPESTAQSIIMSASDLRHLPAVEKLSHQLSKSQPLPKALITNFVQSQLANYRAKILAGERFTREEITADVSSQLDIFAQSRLQPVINATGVMIHTNLGRSPLGSRAAGALNQIATGYSNLEFNLLDGQRGKRASYLETALACLLEAESATTVNNCAAALVLILRTLTTADKNEVIVSRGELVEIGGGFRIPEILETSGAKLIEVGATNKTHLKDYAKAITEKTAIILKVHRSNFYIDGFTAEVDTEELSALAKSKGIPLVEDLGSGAMLDTEKLAPIEHEPRAQECLRKGIDLVCFSGDKLLGGPQAGIIAGNADMVARIKSDPFYRAVRCDKLILTVLQESIDSYLDSKANPELSDIPVLNFISQKPADLKIRAQAIIDCLPAEIANQLDIVELDSTTGGGTMPKSKIPSAGIAVKSAKSTASQIADAMRKQKPALVGFIEDDTYHIHLGTIFPAQDKLIADHLRSILV
ncbi:L-seryl-tRNA(Sec) selenium transferase [Persicirhabdus sediminis]|nr:L-seryl-tRNA(Sec) selenium transferase [Persicirhabdus sediminis]